MRCLFCKSELTVSGESSISREHIVPESLTGFSWLTTNCVCVKCNNLLGSAVDSVADTALLQPFRFDAGLTIERKAAAEIWDQETGELIGGHVDLPTGQFYRRQKVERAASGIVSISGQSLPEVTKIAESEAKKLRARGYEVEMGEPRHNPEHTTLHIQGSAQDIERLKRLSAKVAVEYISLVAGVELALHPSLDSMRQYAVSGEPVYNNIIAGLTMKTKSIWLPRASMSVWIGNSDPSPEEQSLLEHRKRLPYCPELPRPRHRLDVMHKGMMNIRLELFSLFRLSISLPLLSPFVWRGADGCDLLSKERWSQR